MTDDMEFRKEVRETLKEHTKMLAAINQTLSKIAVQDERISSLTNRVMGLEGKMNGLLDPETGTIYRISNFQASCPRKTFRLIWAIVGAQVFVLIGLGIKILQTGG